MWSHRDRTAASSRAGRRSFCAFPQPGLAGRMMIGGLLLMAACTVVARDWSNVVSPAPGPARAIGQTSKGCIIGAAALPQEGPGYQVMHLERHRNFGHPELLAMIRGLGQSTARERLGLLHVGDLGQPRGGPTPFGHRSHQNGLDVDVWFALDPALARSSDPLRSNIRAPSLLSPSGEGLNRYLWEDRHRRVLELAARYPRVDRIFVNPHVKRELCRTAQGDRSWLRKIRPWWGHDDHFHARLFCPPDSPECDSQDTLPPGEGCDGSLDWWFRLSSTLPSPGPKTPRNIPIARMPGSCQALLFE